MNAYLAPRRIIPGISENDDKILTEVKRKAKGLDMKFSCCGIRFGLSNVLGAFPVYAS
jgi:hypothetical protein